MEVDGLVAMLVACQASKLAITGLLNTPYSNENLPWRWKVVVEAQPGSESKLATLQ